MSRALLPLQLESVLAVLKQHLQQQYCDRLNQVVLFGFYARQEATADSDVDVLIVLGNPVDPSAEICQTSEFIARLCLEHDLLISRFFLPTSRYEAENSLLMRNIHQEGIVL
jgi:predicted nucleotidyltransferase